MKEKNKRIVRRWMSTVLIIAMLFACVINDISLPYVSWAGEKASASDAIRNSRVTLKNRKTEKDDKVQIFVLSDQQDYQPGDTVCLELYIKNNTDEIISEGLLRYKAKGIEEDSAYFEDLNDLYTKISEAEEKAAKAEAAAKESKEEETESEAQETESEAQTEESQEQAEESSPVDESDEAEPNSTEETTEAEDESSQDAEEPLQTGEPETTAEEEIKEDSKVSDELSEGDILDNEAEDTDENEEDDPTRLTEIEIEPGKAYYVNFYYTIDPEIEKIKDQNVEFNFSWADDDALIIKRPSVTEKFQYTVDGLNLLPVVVGGEKKWVQIGEEDEMILEFDLGRIEEILEEAEMEELEKNPDATISSARRSSASNALIGWDAEDDGKLKGKDDPTVVRNLKLDVETFDLKLNDFEVVPVDEKTDDNFGTTVACKFKVSRVNEPGTYYGKVNASYKIKNKTYYTSQALRVTVKPEEGEMELTGKIGKSEIVMYGDVSAFPKADELSLKISEVTKEQQEKVEEALRKKSEEEGVEIKEYKALDIKLIADGVETEPEGEVKVRFKNVKAEEPEKDEEEAAEEVQPENQSAVKRFFSRMRTAFRADDEAEPMNIAADDEIKADADKIEANGAEADKAGDETDKADEVKEDEKTEKTAEDGKSEADGSKSIKVLHLDEENVVTEEMTSEVLENGDIVMDTNHFSIYIVVNVPGGADTVKVTVKHYATIDQWEMWALKDSVETPITLALDGCYYYIKWEGGTRIPNTKKDGTPDGTYKWEGGNPVKKADGSFELDGKVPDGTKLNVYEKYGKIDGSYQHTYLYPGTAVANQGTYNQVVTQIFEPDVDVELPNGAGTGGDPYTIDLDKWSKVSGGGHYEVEKVTVNGNVSPIENEDGKKIIKLNEKASNNEIIIYYKPTTGTFDSDVEFFDYNVTIKGTNNGKDDTGKKESNPDGNHNIIRSNRVGMNNPSLVSENTRIGVGIASQVGWNAGIWHDYKNIVDGYANGRFSNMAKPTLKEIEVNGKKKKTIDFNMGDPGLFDVNDLDDNNELHTTEYVNAIYNANGQRNGGSQINNYIAKKYFDNYSLEFARTGDTYILSKVCSSTGVVLDELNRLQYTGPASGTSGNTERPLYSNVFWPMDEEDSYGTPGETRDPLFGAWKTGSGSGKKDSYGFPANDESGVPDIAKDEVKAHNWYFGMRYDFEFDISSDYTGPMNYYFRGDDDFWLYIDGDLVGDVDLGGIYSAQGAYVDLRRWMKNQGKTLSGSHQMSVFFMERGGTGSCCYMSFTFPNITSIPPTKSVLTERAVKKEWLDAEDELRPPTVFVQLKQDDENFGDPVPLTEENGWQYKWENLPQNNKVGGAGLHKYTVEEVSNPPGYEKLPTIEQRTENNVPTFIITNKRVRNIRVKKVWDDQDNADRSRPDSIKVNLYATIGGTKTLEDSQTLHETNGWSYVWENKPLYNNKKEKIVYSVEEEEEAGGGTGWLKTAQNPDGWYTVSYGGSVKDGLTITNTYEKTKHSVIKMWDDELNKLGLRPREVKVQLQVNKKGSEAENDYEPYGEAVTLSVQNAEADMIGTAEEGWRYEWTDLPKYTFSKNPDGTIAKNPDGTINKVLNQYRVVELQVQDEENHKYYKPEYPSQKGENETIIRNKLVDFHELPETGGPGTLWYTFGGLALMAFALMYNILRRRKVLI